MNNGCFVVGTPLARFGRKLIKNWFSAQNNRDKTYPVKHLYPLEMVENPLINLITKTTLFSKCQFRRREILQWIFSRKKRKRTSAQKIELEYEPIQSRPLNWWTNYITRKENYQHQTKHTKHLHALKKTS